MQTAGTLAEVTERLRRLEDIEEIRRLYVDYGRYLDDGDAAGYASLFSQDAKLRLGPVLHANGREEIERAAVKMLGGRSPGEEKGSIHVIDTPRLQLSGDNASGECVWAAIGRGRDGAAPSVLAGRHVDKLVREEGIWRFAERRGFIDIGALA